MDQSNVYATETVKDVAQFVCDFITVLGKYGFMVTNKSTMAMADTFIAHGAEIATGFDLHMIQVCKPKKAALSLVGNPERAVLMPKFVMVFTKNNKTQVRYLSYSEMDIRAVVDDDVFPESLAQTYSKIHSMIDEAL